MDNLEQTEEGEKRSRKPLVNIIIPILIVIAVFGIWAFKNTGSNNDQEYPDTSGLALDATFVDVWRNQSAAEGFPLRVIPTQFFFDKDGNFYGYHEGGMDKAAIIEILEELGVE